jgi:deoxyribonuclease-1
LVVFGCAPAWAGQEKIADYREALMLYMHESYDIPLFTRLGITLKRWSRSDPPSAEERRRNDVIGALQGNRNRFIDDPRAVDELWF